MYLYGENILLSLFLVIPGFRAVNGWDNISDFILVGVLIEVE